MINNLQDLNQIKDQYLEAQKKLQASILLCAGTGCVANGSREIY